MRQGYRQRQTDDRSSYRWYRFWCRWYRFFTQMIQVYMQITQVFKQMKQVFVQKKQHYDVSCFCSSSPQLCKNTLMQWSQNNGGFIDRLCCKPRWINTPCCRRMWSRDLLPFPSEQLNKPHLCFSCVSQLQCFLLLTQEPNQSCTLHCDERW